jgi:hypothetical protein
MMRDGWLLAVASMLAGTVSVACSRQVELDDEQDAGRSVAPPGILLPDGGVPVVDSGLGSDGLGPCGERPINSDCVGANDYPCAAQSLVEKTIIACQSDSGCRASDWVSVSTSEGGCFDSVGMVVQNEAFVRCLVDALGPWRCPCGVTVTNQFMGAGTPEFPGGCG